MLHVRDEHLNFMLRNCAIGRHWDAEQPLFVAAKMRNMINIWTGRGKNYMSVALKVLMGASGKWEV